MTVDPSLPGYAEARWAEEQLKRFTYKPGFEISVRNETYGVCIYMNEIVRDSSGEFPSRHKAQSQVVPFQILDLRQADRFFVFVRHSIHSFERHEVDEWIRVDGVARWNPHLRADELPIPAEGDPAWY